MISEKCKNTYTKLNTFVTNVINRDVTPQLTNLNETTTSLQETKLAKGDWTTLSNTESYTTTKADMVTKNAWTTGVNSPQIMKVEYIERQYQDTSGRQLVIQVTCDVPITRGNIVANSNDGANTSIKTLSGSDNMMICTFGIYDANESDTFNITLKNNNGVITDTYSFSYTFSGNNNYWVDTGYVNVNLETVVTQTSITALADASLTYINNTNKKIRITLTWVSGSFIINGSDHLSASGDELTYTLNPNQSINIISQTSSQLDYTVGTQSNIISSIIDVAYPVGSIYISSNTMHPSVIFGGVWERFAEDKFLLSAGSTYANGSTGGSATVKLTSAQSGVPAHSHKYQDYNTTYTLKTTNRKPGTSTAVAYGTSLTAGGGATERTSSNNTAANASQAHENMPPYLAVYMWERVG